jgi:LuxR family transcriptional regulator, maltose regulon positive regulatory protein
MSTPVLDRRPIPATDSSHGALERPRLLRLIDRPTLAPVTLITAPAGFGKSTLAAQWARHRGRPVAWVSLRPGSNSLSLLLADLAGAVAAAVLDRGGEVLAPDAAEDAGGAFNALAAALDDLAGAGHELALVFDDYHHVENQDVHRAVEALLARLPAGVSVVVLSRTIPPLALGRLRVQGLVREITEADLRFTRAEAEELIAAEANGRLTPSQAARLAERTDGWIAGLRLALLAVERLDAAQVDPFIDAFAEHQWLDA